MNDTDRDLADIKATLGRLEPMLTKLVDGQAALNERLARLEGRIEGQGQWLQSMDQRFTALGFPPSSL